LVRGENPLYSASKVGYLRTLRLRVPQKLDPNDTHSGSNVP